MSPDTAAIILHILAGGALGLVSAGLAAQYGYRSADRLPGESRKPHCVYCLRPLQWFETFPLLSWLVRPKPYTFPCACGKRSGLWPQPLAEGIGFVLGALAVAVGGWSLGIVFLCLGLGLLPAIALVDLSFSLIPDELNLALGILGLGWLASGHGDLFLGLIAAAGLLGLSLFLALGYSKWRKREGLGLGDVKFFAAAGLWIPLIFIPWFLIAAGFIGAVFGLVWKRFNGGREFPFAPALCLSMAGCMIYQLAV